MKFLLTLLQVVFFLAAFGQRPLTVCSWNIQNLGKSKSAAEIEFIANTLREFDVVAIQEVVAGPEGPKAVARLHDALNRKGFKWDYVISQNTSGSKGASERYAFLWKTSRVNIADTAFLDQKFRNEIEREPFIIHLAVEGKILTLVSFHALPKSKQPAKEIRYFQFYPQIYAKGPLLFCGDFNTPQSHSVFNPMKKQGYSPALEGKKTTLRQKCLNDGCLASEYDNFFFRPDQVKLRKAGVVHFYESFADVKKAREISDHLPVFVEVELSGSPEN